MIIDLMNSTGVQAPDTKKIRLSLSDSLTVKNFLIFICADLADEIEAMARDPNISKKELAKSKQDALLVTAYLGTHIDKLTDGIEKPRKLS
jgi:hypothetical protein